MTQGSWGVETLTPAGAGGVAVLRVSGPESLGRLGSMTTVALPAPGEVRLALLREPGADSGAAPLDEALLVGRAAWVEVHTHGSPAIVSAVTELLQVGARGRGAGSPARTLEERAELAVSTAPTASGARVLLDQAGGALRRALEDLLGADEVECKPRLVALCQEGRRSARLWTPTVVALVGPVNAGKSTLFNALVGEEQATVTARPGTTRDALGAPGELGGWPVIYVDTAGERDLASRVAAGDRGAAVEAEGQRLARRVASRAELVLDLSPLEDPASPVGADEELGRGGRIRLRSRAAEVVGADPSKWGPRGISALEDPGRARETVEAVFLERLGLGAGPAWVPGRPVPFEAEMVAGMCDLATAATVDRSALASLLSSL
ncbi:50S ribosome-binding GTPase [Planctomycetota bacterium]|nr:50S ribosome-binding GTPase [Planctomycetota bacterium]